MARDDTSKAKYFRSTSFQKIGQWFPCTIRARSHLLNLPDGERYLYQLFSLIEAGVQLAAIASQAKTRIIGKNLHQSTAVELKLIYRC